jgi:hypothetical protein
MAGLFTPRRFGVLPRCGPARTSLCGRSVHAPRPCARSTSSAQRRDSGPPRGSRPRTPIDPLRHPCRKLRSTVTTLTTLTLETRPVHGPPLGATAQSPSAGVRLILNSSPTYSHVFLIPLPPARVHHTDLEIRPAELPVSTPSRRWSVSAFRCQTRDSLEALARRRISQRTPVPTAQRRRRKCR